ncbi:MAG TPA: phosphoribosylformylglycinamidine cyclo-ligase [Planctomycetaceae bacterium]|jgi:phosphoribosylformylglycinamidine cyclo-ligase|nr:phosphoribosylformylglycinamidine cyclo-ligase [Planctomycetaceae bacterium]
MGQLTYKDAGVDLGLYAQAMGKLPELMRRTQTGRVIDLVGGFAGLFRLNDPTGTPARRYKDPVLVSGTDGAGTKVKVAASLARFSTIGIDLVAMCVNDVLCLGAEPLFFLDYIAMDRDDPERLAELVRGVSDGCVESRMALLGGETAIMPGIYGPGDFDMAGFCVGVVERTKIIDGTAIRPGDKIIGLASSGFHSNGYSLIRKVVFDHSGLKPDERLEVLDRTVGEALLEPTRIYVRPVLDLLAASSRKPVVHGMAHITGGGLIDNVERILPEGCRAAIDRGKWRPPAIYAWFESLGAVEATEMWKTFNMGIGFVLVVAPRQTAAVTSQLAASGVEHAVIGRIQQGTSGVEFAD